MKILSNHKKAVFARIVLDFIYNTNSKVVEGRENIINEINLGKSVILCVWHARLLSVVHNLKNEKVNALAGTHQDADIISRVAASWGWNMIRGSSKEKGDIAYRKIFKILREKQNIFFITPDGPTGPPKIPKLGIIRASQKTQTKVIPIGVYSTKNWGFTNWDTFFLEKPFGKLFIKYGAPIQFGKNESSEKCIDFLIKKMDIVEKECIQNALNK
tara:strand:- start:802 stop:1446 length:645 start_codon:yes stop_codon:yes gene_type:complete